MNPALTPKNNEKILSLEEFFLPLHHDLGNSALVKCRRVRESGERPELFLQL